MLNSNLKKIVFCIALLGATDAQPVTAREIGSKICAIPGAIFGDVKAQFKRVWENRTVVGLGTGIFALQTLAILCIIRLFDKDVREHVRYHESDFVARLRRTEMQAESALKAADLLIHNNSGAASRIIDAALAYTTPYTFDASLRDTAAASHSYGDGDRGGPQVPPSGFTGSGRGGDAASGAGSYHMPITRAEALQNGVPQFCAGSAYRDASGAITVDIDLPAGGSVGLAPHHSAGPAGAGSGAGSGRDTASYAATATATGFSDSDGSRLRPSDAVNPNGENTGRRI